MKNFLFLILAFFIIPFNLTSQGIPSYKLAVLPSKYVINREDTLTALIFISGYGDITKSKLMVYSDMSVTIDTGSFNMTYEAIFSENYANYNIEKENLDDYYRTHKTDSFGIYPIRVEFLAKEVSLVTGESGTHKFYAILTYTNDDKKYYSDRIEFEYYVNSCLDRNQTWLIFLGVGIALIGLFKKSIIKVFKKSSKSQ